MKSRPLASRVASGLQMFVPQGWGTVDALEARSPEGATVSVVTYPIEAGVDAGSLAKVDSFVQSEGDVEAEPAWLFGGLEAVTRVFEWEAGAESYVQLAGYAVLDGRAVVGRVTAAKDAFAELQPLLRELLETVSVSRVEPGPSPTPVQGTELPAGRSQLARFLAGDSGILKLNEGDSTGLELESVRSAWLAGAKAEEPDADPSRVAMSGLELHAVAQLYGAPMFPGVTGSELHDQASRLLGRSVLLARGLVSISENEDLELVGPVAQLASAAIGAKLMVETLAGGRPMRHIHYLSAAGAVQIQVLPGDVHICRAFEPERLLDLVLESARLNASSDTDSRGPDAFKVEAGQPWPDELGPPSLRGVSRAARSEGELVTADELRWVAFPGAGLYVSDDDRDWRRIEENQVPVLFSDFLVGDAG